MANISEEPSSRAEATKAWFFEGEQMLKLKKTALVGSIAALLMAVNIVGVASAAPSGNRSAEFDHAGKQTQCDATDPSGFVDVPLAPNAGAILTGGWMLECFPTAEDADGGPDNPSTVDGDPSGDGGANEEGKRPANENGAP